MSVKVMALVWDHGPEAAADRMMLLALADHADDDGHCYPGMERLARKCCVEVRTAQRTLRRLEEAGWVQVEAGGPQKGVSGGATNRYRIDLRKLVTPMLGGDADVRGGGDAHVTRVVTPTSPEPSVEPSVEPSGGGSPTVRPQERARSKHPEPMTPGWTPNPEAIADWKRRYSADVDVDVCLERFVNYHLTSDQRSANWTAKFGAWLMNDVGRSRDARRQSEGGADDFGLFPWQR